MLASYWSQFISALTRTIELSGPSTRASIVRTSCSMEVSSARCTCVRFDDRLDGSVEDARSVSSVPAVSMTATFCAFKPSTLLATSCVMPLIWASSSFRPGFSSMKIEAVDSF